MNILSMVISIQLMTKGVCELKLPEEKVPRTSVLLDIVLRHFLSYLPCYTIANGGGYYGLTLFNSESEFLAQMKNRHQGQQTSSPFSVTMATPTQFLSLQKMKKLVKSHKEKKLFLDKHLRPLLKMVT